MTKFVSIFMALSFIAVIAACNGEERVLDNFEAPQAEQDAGTKLDQFVDVVEPFPAATPGTNTTDTNNDSATNIDPQAVAK